MDPQEDKNKQYQAPEDIKALEQEMKMAYKGENFEAVKTLYDRIIRHDAENRLAHKLMQKIEKAKDKEARKAKEKKAEEYVDMLKKLYKENDVEKLVALTKEFKEFDPENKDTAKWEAKAAKLQEKLTGKVSEKAAETKPPVAEPKKEEKKEGIFRIGLKEEEKKEEPAKAEVKPTPMKPAPAAPIKPLGMPKMPQPAPSFKIPEAPKAPAPAVAAPVIPKAPAPAVAASVPIAPVTPKTEIKKAPEEGKGNLFTKMFGKKEEEIDKKSIIDTIVAKTDKKEVKKEEEKKIIVRKEEEKQPAKKQEMAGLLTFSRIFMNFTIIFIALSAAFLYVEWIDKDNTVLGLAGISENTGGRLHNASLKIEDLQEEEIQLNKDIELFKEGYEDKTVETVNKLISERINWPDIFDKIKQVTNSVYELNDFFKYIEYNNYSFDAEKGAIRVSGTLSDPLGRNLTKLVELEEAFKYFPKDKNNPEDTTKPYFTGFKEFTSFSKSLDADTGRYHSSFQLSFTLNE
ncbi:hypothetical protein JXD20_01765 [Candidatus Peregrinibacteria bacterium]|nr:hypothetical protein [Candidatus Peregrinibacteria bacterium]